MSLFLYLLQVPVLYLAMCRYRVRSYRYRYFAIWIFVTGTGDCGVSRETARPIECFSLRRQGHFLCDASGRSQKDDCNKYETVVSRRKPLCLASVLVFEGEAVCVVTPQEDHRKTMDKSSEDSGVMIIVTNLWLWCRDGNRFVYWVF